MSGVDHIYWLDADGNAQHEQFSSTEYSDKYITEMDPVPEKLWSCTNLISDNQSFQWYKAEKNPAFAFITNTYMPISETVVPNEIRMLHLLIG